MFNVFKKQDRHTPEPERKYGLYAVSFFITGALPAALFVWLFTVGPFVESGQQIYSIVNSAYVPPSEVQEATQAAQERAKAVVEKVNFKAFHDWDKQPKYHTAIIETPDIFERPLFARKVQKLMRDWEKRTGKTWTEHPSLQPRESEPVNMGTLLMGSVGNTGIVGTDIVRTWQENWIKGGYCYGLSRSVGESDRDKPVKCHDETYLYYWVLKTIYEAKAFWHWRQVMPTPENIEFLKHFETNHTISVIDVKGIDHRILGDRSHPIAAEYYGRMDAYVAAIEPVDIQQAPSIGGAGMNENQLGALRFFALAAFLIAAMLYGVMGTKYGLFRAPRFLSWVNFGIGAIVFGVGYVFLLIYSASVAELDVSFGGDLLKPALILIPPFLLLTGPALWMYVKEWFKETDFYQETLIEGRGQQTSRWGGLKTYFERDITEWMQASRGGIVRTVESPIYIGRTMWQYDPKIGGRDIGFISEQHLATVAGTGAGKSRDAISNNVLSYNGGMIAFDPKGEHVRFSLKRRKAYAPVQVIDPYGTTGEESAFWNPLDEVDPQSPHARAILTRLSEAIIPKEPQERAVDIHFREIPQKIVRGYLAHILTEYPKEQRHLPSLYDLFVKGVVDGEDFNPNAVGKVIEAMAENNAIGGAPAEAAAILAVLSDRARSEHYSSISRALDWVNDPLMRKIVSKPSTFSIADCKRQDATVYLVFPMRHLKMTARFLGLFYTMALDKLNESETPQREGSKRRVLFLFDEFEILAAFEPARNAALRARSSNIKCWFVVQNFHQFISSFGKEKLQDFLGGSDKQFFGVDASDTELSQLISEALGSYTILEQNQTTEKVTKTPEALMSPGGVQKFLNARRPRQLVIPVHGYPMRLRRVSVGKNFGDEFDGGGRRRGFASFLRSILPE